MSDMIERMAQAMSDTYFSSADTPIIRRGMFEQMARAAIEAMREPTEAVLLVIGHGAIADVDREDWQRAIDAALEEK